MHTQIKLCCVFPVREVLHYNDKDGKQIKHVALGPKMNNEPDTMIRPAAEFDRNLCKDAEYFLCINKQGQRKTFGYSQEGLKAAKKFVAA